MGYLIAISLRWILQKQATNDMRRLLIVRAASNRISRAKILFRIFFCAGGLEFKYLNRRTEADIDTMNPRQLMMKV